MLHIYIYDISRLRVNTLDVKATLFSRLCSLRGRRSYAPVVMVTIVSVLSGRHKLLANQQFL